MLKAFLILAFTTLIVGGCLANGERTKFVEEHYRLNDGTNCMLLYDYVHPGRMAMTCDYGR